MNSLKYKEKQFINRLKYAEQKVTCICIDNCKIYEGNEFSEIYKVLLSALKKVKLKMNNILIEKYKKMLDFLDFEQNHYSLNSTGFYRIGHDSIGLLKWLVYRP